MSLISLLPINSTIFTGIIQVDFAAILIPTKECKIVKHMKRCKLFSEDRMKKNLPTETTYNV